MSVTDLRLTWTHNATLPRVAVVLFIKEAGDQRCCRQRVEQTAINDIMTHTNERRSRSSLLERLFTII